LHRRLGCFVHSMGTTATRQLLQQCCGCPRSGSEDGPGTASQDSTCSELAERHAVLIRMVKQLPALCEAKRLVWSFLRDPSELVIMRMRSVDIDKHLLRQAPLDYLHVMELSLEFISLQTTKTLQILNAQLNVEDMCRVKRALRGPSSAEGLLPGARSWWWDICGCSAVLRDEPLTRRGQLMDWLKIGSSASNSVTSFMESAGNSWKAVASLEAGWVAQVWRRGRTIVTDLVTGESLGSCDTVTVAEGDQRHDLLVVAQKDILAVCAETTIDIVKVRPGRLSAGGADVMLLSRSSMPLRGRLCDPLALNSTKLAALCCTSTRLTGTMLLLYDLTEKGISADPLAVLSPRAQGFFLDVYLTHDKLITSESMGTSKVTEVVVRDCDRPLDAPLHVLWAESLPHPHACRPRLACGVGLAMRFQALIGVCSNNSTQADVSVEDTR